MAAATVKVMGYDGNPFDQNSIQVVPRFIKTVCKLLFQAGDYVTGGLTLDWTNGGGSPSYPNAFPPAAAGVAAGPSRVSMNVNSPVGGVVNLGGGYVLVPGTNPTNWKIMIYKTAGSEYGATALLADVLTDNVILEAEWVR